MSSKVVDVAERQILRKDILSILAETDEQGATTKVLKAVLLKFGYSVSDLSVNLELKYLAGKDLVRMEIVANQALGIKREVAHITSKGIDLLEGTIMVEGIEVGE